MRDLLREPAWSPQDLGTPLPVMEHACSVCLPTWESTVGYEEGWQDVLDKLESGYPRFLLNPHVSRLFEKAERELCQSDERAIVLPTLEAVQRAQDYLTKQAGVSARTVPFVGLHALIFAKEAYRAARNYWKHTGEIVSSRLAQDALANNIQKADPASVFKKMAPLMEVPQEDLFLFESGMAAIFAAYRTVTTLHPGKKTLQVDFPYVDALKIQEQFGVGVEFMAHAHGEAFSHLLTRIRSGEFAGVFCEIPSNPLLRSVDLVRLSEACRVGGTFLAVDDTICSHLNLQTLPLVDLVTTSLTKWVSGIGDVMAGSLKLNCHSPFSAQLSAFLSEDFPSRSRLYQRDAEALVANSTGFPTRIQKANQSGEQIAEMLSQHSAVAQVWYPKFCNSKNYDQLLRASGGYGGLISFSLKNSESAPKVYDALRWSKGPSLGTEFSLACAYTLLAHYYELEWAADCGVPSHLIRLSVGLESVTALQESLENALALASS